MAYHAPGYGRNSLFVESQAYNNPQESADRGSKRAIVKWPLLAMDHKNSCSNDIYISGGSFLVEFAGQFPGEYNTIISAMTSESEFKNWKGQSSANKA